MSVNKSRVGWAIGETVLATLIWASTFIFVKLIVADIGPLTLAGLRYLIAFVFFLPWVMRAKRQVGPLPTAVWYRLLLLGVVTYGIGSGAMFVALLYMSATAASLIMGTVPIFILVVEHLWLGQRPLPIQITGVFLSFAGGFLFFQQGIEALNQWGLLMLLLAVIGFVLFPLLIRELGQKYQVPTILLTSFPFLFGGGSLLIPALMREGLPHGSWVSWGNMYQAKRISAFCTF